MAYKSELDRFDMERGDVLSMSREMAKAIVGFGPKIGSPILYNLLLWFSGNPGDPPPEMDDPRDNGFLAMLMEHQRKNATKRADFLAKQKEKGLASAAKAAERRQATNDNHGQPRSTTALSTSIDKEQVPEGEGLVSLSVPNKLGAATPSAGGPDLTAAPGDVATVYRDCEPEPTHAIRKADLAADPIGVMLDFLNPSADERERTRNALAKSMREATRDTFAAVCWKFLKDAEAKTKRWREVRAILEDYCDKSGVDWEALPTKRPKDWRKYEKIEAEAVDFAPDDGEPARLLFGRLKAYKHGKKDATE